MGSREYVAGKLDELEAILAEWDERFGEVDLDADETALQDADRLLDEYARQKLMLEHDPRFHAASAAAANQVAG